MTFVWRTGAVDDPAEMALSHNAAHGLRIGVSVVLAIALVYLFLIVKTFQKYGDAMDKRFNTKVVNWAREGRYAQIGSHPAAWQPSPLRSWSRSHSRSRSPRRYGSRSPRARRSYSPYPTPIYMMSSPRSISPRPRSWRPHRGHGSVMRERSRGSPLILADPGPSFGRPFTAEREFAPFPAAKVKKLPYDDEETFPPSLLQDRDILIEDWWNFILVG